MFYGIIILSILFLIGLLFFRRKGKPKNQSRAKASGATFIVALSLLVGLLACGAVTTGCAQLQQAIGIKTEDTPTTKVYKLKAAGNLAVEAVIVLRQNHKINDADYELFIQAKNSFYGAVDELMVYAKTVEATGGTFDETSAVWSAASGALDKLATFKTEHANGMGSIGNGTSSDHPVTVGSGGPVD